VGYRAGLDGRKISSPPGIDSGPSSPLYVFKYILYILHIYIYIERERERAGLVQVCGPG